MRTIEYMKPEKIEEKCRETLDIYAPLASRLGIATVKFELEDIALKYLHPQEYQQLVDGINKKMAQRETRYLRVDEIKESLDDMGLEYEIYGRAKHYYSIYKKMKFQKKQLDEIFDLIAVRVIVNTVKECYAVLGNRPHHVEADPGPFQGLYRYAQAEHVPVAAYDGHQR